MFYSILLDIWREICYPDRQTIGRADMQTFFKRYEEKYFITQEQTAMLEALFQEHMDRDKFDVYWVQNLYFDTENWDVIRTSIEKPFFKEKMRLRCYGVPTDTQDVFLELKKKYDGIVYKRRIFLPVASLSHLEEALVEESSQIAQELLFYLRSTGVEPKMFVAYQRQAFVGKESRDLRITLDGDIHYRLDQLDFFNPEEGIPLPMDGCHVMEVKTPTAFPLWLVEALSKHKIFGSSFSKFGSCFIDYVHGAKRKAAVSYD